MLKSLQNALKIKEVRDRILYTLAMLLVIRFGSNLPIPGVNTEYLKTFSNSSGRRPVTRSASSARSPAAPLSR